VPVVWFLNVGSPDGYAPVVAAIRQGLKETGYVEGQNVAVEYRWAENIAGACSRSRPPPRSRDRSRHH
jgi:hypothetical protein